MSDRMGTHGRTCTAATVAIATLGLAGCGLLPHRIEPGARAETMNVVSVEDGKVVATSPMTPDKLKGKIESKYEPDSCTQYSFADSTVVDSSRVFIEETTCAASLWLDGLFGEQRNIAAARGTYGNLVVGYSYSQFDGSKVRVRFHVRVDLPNLKDRLSAFLGRDNEEDFVRDRSEALALRTQFPHVDDKDRWLAGLGYSLPSSERLQTDFRVGVHNLIHPKLFVQARAHYNAYADRVNLVFLRATPFWNTEDHFGLTGAIEYNRALNEHLLLRQANVATVTQEQSGVSWLSAISVYQSLKRERGIGYELFVRGQTGAPEPLREYGGRLIYRHPLVPQHLYLRLIPGYSWPRTDPAEPRDGSYSIGGYLELPFGEKPRR